MSMEEATSQARNCAYEFSPNQEYYLIESYEYNDKEREWFIQIDTPNELLGISCYYYQDKIDCTVSDTDIPLSRSKQ